MMRMHRRNLAKAAGSAVLVSLMARGQALGHNDHSGATPDSHGEHMHASPASGTGAGAGAVFMEITNNGDQPDILLSGNTDVAEIVEIHTMEFQNDVMIMSELEDGLEIPDGETVLLESGGYHVMLINLTQDLKRGESFELELTFERAGDVTVPVVIDTESGDTEVITVGDLEIARVFARPAPMLGTATPEATPGH